MTDWTEIGVLSAVIVGVGVAFGVPLLYYMVKHDRSHSDIGWSFRLLAGTIASIGPKFTPQMDTVLRTWEAEHSARKNPITPEQARDRQVLTERIQRGDILSNEELGRLLGILNSELTDAQATGAIVVAIAIVVLIGVVIAALAAAG